MQTVLITGSNRGLGYEFTRQYLAQDAQVIASCRQPSSANQLHLLKKNYGKKLTIIPLDVTQENSIKEAFNLVEKNFSHLDILLNNAGIGLRKNLQELTLDDLTNVFLTNAAAPLIITRTFLPLLAKGNRPLIANITSRLGSITGFCSLLVISDRYPKNRAEKLVRSTRKERVSAQHATRRALR